MIDLYPTVLLEIRKMLEMKPWSRALIIAPFSKSEITSSSQQLCCWVSIQAFGWIVNWMGSEIKSRCRP